MIDLKDTAPRYRIQPPCAANLPYERRAIEVLGPFTSTLNLEAFRGWAAQFYTGPLAVYSDTCYTTGFPTLTQATPHVNLSAVNTIQPGTPEGDAYDEQLTRLRNRNRLISTTLPTCVGTRVLPILSTTKIQVGPASLRTKITCRPVLNGSWPKDGTDRRAWINPPETCFSVPITTIDRAALILAKDMVSACCFDYASFYEYIPKPISEVAGSATWWRGEFHYNLDHGFGEVTTCFNADIHGRLLQAVQQHHIDKVTVVPGSIVLDRRTDDTLMLINRAGIPDAPRAIKAFKRVCTTAGQPLQDSKEQLMQTVFIFDGLAYDLMAKAIGYPRSKQAKLLPVLAQALNISRTRALNEVPAHARGEMAIIFDAVGFTAGKLSRRECERLTGAIEFTVIALVHLRARVPPIRQSYLHGVGDDTRVTFSTEATSCLRLLYNLYTRLDTIWFPLRDLFEHQPDFDIYTDASGRQVPLGKPAASPKPTIQAPGPRFRAPRVGAQHAVPGMMRGPDSPEPQCWSPLSRTLSPTQASRAEPPTPCTPESMSLPATALPIPP